MKQTVQVNIGGCAFNVDQDSYVLIDEYLKELQGYYGGSPDGKEIVEDIEERLAELLLERCGSASVVSVADARYAIGILGTPSNIGEDIPGAGTKSAEKPRKRLYRNPEGRFIGGVCSGLATYLNWDVTLIRIVLLVLFLASFAAEQFLLVIPVAYLICWIAMPKADTVQKQCELRGEQLSAAGIEQRVKGGQQVSGAPAGQVAGRILGFICGLLLFLTGLSALSGGIFVASLPALASLNPDVAQAISEGMNEIGLENIRALGITTMIVAALVYFIPCIIAIYYGILLMFGLKSPSWRPGLIMVLIWVISLLVLIPLLAINLAAIL